MPIRNYSQHQKDYLAGRLQRAGFTLVEIMIVMATLLIVIIGVMQGFLFFFTAGEKAEAKIQALLAAQDKIEEIRAANFDDIQTKDFVPLNANDTSTNPQADDMACQDTDSDGDCDYGSFVYADGTGSGFIYIDNTTNPELLEIEVVMCWQSESGGRVIGEDQNLNGILDGAEDDDGDTKVDSPLILRTLVTRR